MKKMLILLFLCQICLPGDKGGTGGDLLICPGKTDLLDYYEGSRDHSNFSLDLGDESLTALQKVWTALNRLSNLDGPRALILWTEAKVFLGKTIFVKGPLEAIPDIGETKIPADCNFKQVAIQRIPVHPADKPYIIDETLWLKLPSTLRAGLILHEIIYKMTQGLGHQTSLKARLFNYMISSNLISTLNSFEYSQFAKEVFKPEYSVAFKDQKFEFTIKKGQVFTLALSDLLKHSGRNPLKWFVSSKAGWVNYDAAKVQLNGTSMAPGVFEVQIAVQDGDFGAITELKITVID